MSSYQPVNISLGCFGRHDEGFILCSGITNTIFTLTNDHYYYEEIMAFLDNCKLFDKAIFDYNACRSFLSSFRSKFESPVKPIWKEKKYNMYLKFVSDHKDCGLCLKLSVSNST